MKKRILCWFWVMMMSVAVLMAEENKPKIAVVVFSINDARNSKLVNDAIAIRNQVQSNIVKTGQYDVIARDEIDKLLENQKIQASQISSAENIKKLKLLNISYIITGTVDAVDSDYVVTISMLDVSNGKFSFSDEEFMSNSSQKMYTGTKTLTERFIKRLGVGSDGVKASDKKEYKIGDKGPGGGIVFYKEGNTYYEVSEFLGQATWDEAKSMCKCYRGGGYSDWLFPRSQQLNRIYENLRKTNIISDDDCYWSTDSTDGNIAVAKNFKEGIEYKFATDYSPNKGKNYQYSVRAVRAF